MHGNLNGTSLDLSVIGRRSASGFRFRAWGFRFRASGFGLGASGLGLHFALGARARFSCPFFQRGTDLEFVFAVVLFVVAVLVVLFVWYKLASACFIKIVLQKNGRKILPQSAPQGFLGLTFRAEVIAWLRLR